MLKSVSNNANNFRIRVPGVGIDVIEDGLGHQYPSPKYVGVEKGFRGYYWCPQNLFLDHWKVQTISPWDECVRLIDELSCDSRFVLTATWGSDIYMGLYNIMSGTYNCIEC